MTRWSDATAPQAQALMEIREGKPVTVRSGTLMACWHAGWFVFGEDTAPKVLTASGEAALDAYLARQNPPLPRGSLTDLKV